MTTKWTPGPWWAAKRAPKHLGSVIAIVATQGTKVATGVAHAWTKGDADLIAAAPALYEALEAAPSRHHMIPAGLPDAGACIKGCPGCLRRAALRAARGDDGKEG